MNKKKVRINNYGYRLILNPDHPRADVYGYVFESVLVAEKALGKYISRPVEIHHIDENKGNDKNDNLVVCQDRAYHKLIHRRMRALRASGHADYRLCPFCGEYDSLENLTKQSKCGFAHPQCRSLYAKEKYQMASAIA